MVDTRRTIERLEREAQAFHRYKLNLVFKTFLSKFICELSKYYKHSAVQFCLK